MALNTLNQTLLIPDGSSYIFDANRNRYAIFVSLTDPMRKLTVSIPMTSTESVEWVNELNRFYLTGEIVVDDTTGQIGNLVGCSNVVCTIVFGRFQPIEPVTVESRDPSFGPALAKVETQELEEVFQHTFLVRNFEILGKTEQVVKYKLSLVSTNYLGCTRRIQYSNYKESKPVDVYEIVQNLAQIAFHGILNPDEYLLDNGGCMSGVELYWCTRPDDTIVTATSRLFNLLFAAEKVQLNGGGDKLNISEQRLKIAEPSTFFIPYVVTIPHITKIPGLKAGYKLVNFNSSFTTQREASGGTIIFLDGAGFEELVRKNPQRLGSITAERSTSILKRFQTYDYWFYNSKDGTMVPQRYGTKELVNLWNDDELPGETSLQKNRESDIEKMFKLAEAESKPELMADHVRVFGQCRHDNLHVYSDLASLFLYSDSIVFEKDGNLADLPGNNIVLADENAPTLKADAIDVLDGEHKSKANNQLIGEYNIVRTRHIVRPNVQQFTENLILARKGTRDWKH